MKKLFQERESSQCCHLLSISWVWWKQEVTIGFNKMEVIYDQENSEFNERKEKL
jgi:hypothetical protein